MEPILEVRNISYVYSAGTPFEHRALENVSFSLHRGEFVGVIGHTGSGKSTLMQQLNGLLKPTSGQVLLDGRDIWSDKKLTRQARFRVGLVFQYPEYQLFEETVYQDIAFGPKNMGLDEKEVDRRVRSAAELVGITNNQLKASPFDLSGGQKRRAAIAGVMAMEPEVLILDEPTAGLDPVGRKEILDQIGAYRVSRNAAVVMVSHDLEFCAENAQWCVLLFDGAAAAADTPRRFFAGSRFYTTAANRMAEGQLPEAVTAAEVIESCGGAEMPDISRQAAPGRPLPPEETAARRERRGGSRLPALLSLLVLVPLTVLAGMALFQDRKYLFTALLVLLECTAAFLLSFERRRPQAREVAVIAVLCALGVAGRAAFSMLPQCKPVIALTVLTGAALGGESGFLVGAVTMLASNVLFGQGPWTPWQMFAMGLIGLLSGALFCQGPLPAKRGPLAVFGAVSALAVYGLLLNTASVLMWQGTPTWGMVLAYWTAGLPMDLVQAAATAVYLWLLTGPVLEKLERLRDKYGVFGF